VKERSSTTIGEMLVLHAAHQASAPAILHPGIVPLTFAGLDGHLRRLADRLRSAGLGASSRIGVVLPRGPDAALLSLAVCSMATLVPLNPHLAVAELEAELEGYRLDALVIAGGNDVPGWAYGADGLFQLSKAVSSFNEVDLTQVTAVRRRRDGEDRPTAQSVALIFRTSGTTGTAKRVPITHENLLEMASKMERWLRLTPADRSACVMPLYYNAGFKATLLSPLLIGCSVALPATTHSGDFEQWMQDLRPTWLTGAPVFLQSVLERLRARDGGRLDHALRFVLSTSSYLSDVVRTELERLLGVPVLEFYGLSEAGMITGPPVPPEKARPGTVGRIPAGELAIRGDNGTFLTAGQPGQIVVRGPSVTPGYLLDVDDSPTGLQDGWLVTGDTGSVDRDGFLTIVGRTQEFINRGGEKVSPYDVEKVLLRHPAVREAAAFAVPHPRLGENVAAAVVLAPGLEITSSQLIDFLYDRLAPYQLPRHVEILPALPVGLTGKISRSQLTALFAGHVRAIVPPVQPLQIQIAETWKRYLKRDDIGIDDDFFELGGDSLQATEMLLELEEATHHPIAPSDIRAELTIRHLAQALVRVAASDEMVTKVKDGSGPPLFLCHGDYDGWGLYAHRLVELLRSVGPVYLLHSNLQGAPGSGTIEAMARRYVPHLLAAWPQGAFRLAGYCHGGLAAWEVAHQLEAAGRKVERLVLIDTYSLNARPALRAAARFLKVVGGEGMMPDVWGTARRVMQHDRAILWRIGRRLLGLRHHPDSNTAEAAATTLRWSYYRAMAAYLPPGIDADVTCLLSEEYFDKKEFATEVWRRLAWHVEAERVPGKHNTCITSHVADLATTLNRHFAPV